MAEPILCVDACTKCGQVKPISDFYPSKQNSRGHNSWCKTCFNIQHRIRSLRNKEELKRKAIERKARLGEIFYIRKRASGIRQADALRDSTFKAYGGKCVCCGESNYAFLTIDVISGGHRKSKQSYGTTFYRKLRMEGYPQGYQTMCFNCNWAKHRFGECPHKNKKFEVA